MKSKYNIYVTKTAFKNAAITYQIKYNSGNDENNFILQINESIDAMYNRIDNFLKENKALKFNMTLHVIFEKATDSSIITKPPVCLVSEQMEIYYETNILEHLDFVKKQLLNQIEIYEQNGSGWILSRLVALDTSAWKLNPLRGSSTFHSLPHWIRSKHAVVNIRNEDNKCFKWRFFSWNASITIKN